MGRKKYISLNQTKDIVVYREAKYSDIPELCGIVSEAFDFGSFLDNEKDLYSMTKCFLGQYFVISSFCQVAVLNGKIVGVIFGLAKTQNWPLLHFGAKIKLAPCNLGFVLKSILKPKYYRSFIGQKELYDSLEPQISGLDGDITLFAVSSEACGHGIGKNLIEQLYSHFRRHKVKRIYVLTDNMCTYEFYEKQGFERTRTGSIEIIRNNKPFVLEAYRYEKDLEY